MAAKTTVLCEEEAFILSTMNALWKNRCINLIIELKVPELLCTSEQSSLSIEDIAKTLGCASSKGIYPVMKLLAQWGIGKELDNKYFAKNRGMELLRRDNGPSLGHMFAYFSGDEHYSAMRSLAACVKRDEPCFVLEHGMSHFQYMNGTENHSYDKEKMFEGSSVHLIGSDERRAEFVQTYSNAMVFSSKLLDLPGIAGINNVFEAFPWATCKKLVDMGGCSGHFLASILKLPNCHHIQGYIVDLPEVVENAQNGVTSLGIPEHRIEFIKHDFTQPFPSDLKMEVDTVIFRRVLAMYLQHNGDVLEAILLNCRSLFPSRGGRVLIIHIASSDPCNKGNNVGINGEEIEAESIHLVNVRGDPFPSRSDWIEIFGKTNQKTGFLLNHIYETFPGGFTIFELTYR